MTPESPEQWANRVYLANRAEFEDGDPLRIRYNRDPVFKERADRIHSSRMLSGPACDECLKMAASQEAVRPA